MDIPSIKRHAAEKEEWCERQDEEYRHLKTETEIHAAGKEEWGESHDEEYRQLKTEIEMLVFVNGMLLREALDLLLNPEHVVTSSSEPLMYYVPMESETHPDLIAMDTEILSRQVLLLNCANQQLLQAHRHLQRAADQSRSSNSLSKSYLRYVSPPSLIPIEWISSWRKNTKSGANNLEEVSTEAADVVNPEPNVTTLVPDVPIVIPLAPSELTPWSILRENNDISPERKETKHTKKRRTRSICSQLAVAEHDSSSEDEGDTISGERSHASQKTPNRRRPNTFPCRTLPEPSAGCERTAVQDIPPVPDKVYKIIMMGDTAVGKTSILVRLCNDTFTANMRSTFGMDMKTKTMRVDKQNVAIQLWDTVGQERFRCLSKSYYRRADGVMLVYDCTREQSFINVRQWMDSLEDNIANSLPIMLCGNKVDMREEADRAGRKIVTFQDGQKLAREYNALFLETSAKDGYNISDTLLDLVRQIMAEESLDLKTVSIRLHSDTSKHTKYRRPCCH